MARATHHVRESTAARSSLRKLLRDNGLALVLTVMFLACIFGQSVAGVAEYNEEQQQHGESPVTYAEYLRTGHFLEATMENWESEFLQMFGFLLLTAYLFQRGSAESRKLGEKRTPSGAAARSAEKPNAPGAVKRGGIALRLYEHSLSLTFLLLFVVSFVLHAVGGVREHNAEQQAHGGEMMTVTEYIGSSSFWFESMQNWQSEFLALVAMVVLSIWLRERGSPQSKPVDAPHSQTGHD
jgi:hypothetical protein